MHSPIVFCKISVFGLYYDFFYAPSVEGVTVGIKRIGMLALATQ